MVKRFLNLYVYLRTSGDEHHSWARWRQRPADVGGRHGQTDGDGAARQHLQPDDVGGRQARRAGGMLMLAAGRRGALCTTLTGGAGGTLWLAAFRGLWGGGRGTAHQSSGSARRKDSCMFVYVSTIK
jgi:hypothetical protein